MNIIATHPVPGTGYRLILESGESTYIGSVFLGGRVVERTEDTNEDIVRAWLNAQWTARRDARGTIIEPDRFYVVEASGELTAYRTYLSQSSGHPYAKRLDGGTWTYAPGAIRDIQVYGRRMTVEEAAQMSRVLTFCIRCGRHLTHPESVSAGIGPVCAGRI